MIPAHAMPEPQEDPRNLLLDAFEGQVMALIENGFEVQLRARLSRLLPDNKPDPAPQAIDPDRAIRLAGVLIALRAAQTARMSLPQYEANAVARRFVMAELKAVTQ